MMGNRKQEYQEYEKGHKEASGQYKMPVINESRE